ncbi:MAG: class I SAM-dependent methyltransferase [Zetaproteobacteria bacterium]|nr:MAG: class I SAM-dependent methyltransferase [Zetaproteobacteria bacterium]
MESTTNTERIKRPWEEQYRDDDVETMPWFCPHLDRDVAWAIEMLPIAPAKALDLGCGPGTQAIELSRLGFETTGVDISPSAVRKADERARKEGMAVTFICDDILNTQLSDSYGVIIDRGCFHVLDADQRPNYLRSVLHLLDGNGFLLLKTFHKQETCEIGPPNRFDAADIVKIFSDTFELVEYRDSFFESTMDSNPKALFCILKKKQEDK